MNTSLTRFCAVYLLVFAGVQAQDSALRRYPLRKHGSLEMTVPVAWKQDVRQSSDDVPPTIEFSPKSGEPFKVLVTPLWSPSPEIPLPTPEETRQRVAATAEHSQSQAVERVIPVRTLKATSGTGYYYFATDRAPKPGEFKYLTQGMLLLRAGDLLVTFTILTNDGQESVAKDALAMVAGANQK